MNEPDFAGADGVPRPAPPAEDQWRDLSSPEFEEREECRAILRSLIPSMIQRIDSVFDPRD